MSEPDPSIPTNGHSHEHSADDKEEVCPACYLSRAVNDLTGDLYIAVADFCAGSNDNLVSFIKGTVSQVFDVADDPELKALFDRILETRDKLYARRDKDAKEVFAAQMEDAETLRAFVTKAAGGADGSLTEETAFKILACVNIDPDAPPTDGSTPLDAGIEAFQQLLMRYMTAKAEAEAKEPQRVTVEPVPMPGIGGWDAAAAAANVRFLKDMPETIKELVELRRLGLIDQFGVLSMGIRAAMMLQIQQEMEAKAGKAETPSETPEVPGTEVGSGG